ncbi:Tetratricopeptide repeat protein 5 [Nymphaea thermarum]|nr:Tetratricopeptide repeat protein 5 [Nymphaea thermarum]
MEEGIEGVVAGEGVADPIAGATKAADDLYAFRDTYFPSDPVEKISALHQQADIALRILDDAFPLATEVNFPAFHADQRKKPSQRASFEFLRGKILDVYPDYRKEAEDHLSKAVKLNPSLLDAWLCLGNCMWKKGDLSSARNCFSLALEKGPDKKILSQLSMLERRLAQGKESFFMSKWEGFDLRTMEFKMQGAENQSEMVDESIRHAKEAVMLDVKDGYSWYILGNAFLTSFFVAGAWEQRKLLQSIKAYQNAEKDEKANTNPDLYFNCAIANRYLENYERALSGFDAAASKDPSLNAKEEAGKIVDLLNKLEDSILKKVISFPIE